MLLTTSFSFYFYVDRFYVVCVNYIMMYKYMLKLNGQSSVIRIFRVDFFYFDLNTHVFIF